MVRSAASRWPLLRRSGGSELRELSQSIRPVLRNHAAATTASAKPHAATALADRRRRLARERPAACCLDAIPRRHGTDIGSGARGYGFPTARASRLARPYQQCPLETPACPHDASASAATWPWVGSAAGAARLATSLHRPHMQGSSTAPVAGWAGDRGLRLWRVRLEPARPCRLAKSRAKLLPLPGGHWQWMPARRQQFAPPREGKDRVGPAAGIPRHTAPQPKSRQIARLTKPTKKKK